MKLLYRVLFYFIFVQLLIYSPYLVKLKQPKAQPIQAKKDLLHPNQAQLEACADCHPREVEGFKETHMSKAMALPKDSLIIENFAASLSTVIHPKTGVAYRAYIDNAGRWWQEEFDPNGDYKRRVQVKYLIGSGNNTRSYIGEISGELVELPLTWYAPTKNKAGLWDMSPGYHRKNHYRFSRPVKGDCLFCHNDLTKIDSNKLAGFADELPHGITCIRCHGDGTAHIESRLNGIEPKSGEADPTIYNSKYESLERQHQLCEQCHLSGEARSLLPHQSWDNYDPRTPLEDYLQIYAFPIKNKDEVKADLSFGIASHSERTKLSLCAQNSSKFTCTTCHNPHQADTPESYQQACLGCHQSSTQISHHQKSNLKKDLNQKVKACTKEEKHLTGQKLCYECHMKQGGTSDIPHVSMTDHWIRKKPEDQSSISTEYESDLESLLPPLKPENKSYQEALLGLAYADLVRYNQRTEFTQKALKLLVRGAQVHPKWPELWSSLGELSNALGDPLSARAAYTKYGELRPNDEYYRLKEVATLNILNQDQQAERILNELINQEPLSYRPIEHLANLRFKQKRFDEAAQLYKQASKLAPHAHSPLFNHAFMMLITGDLKKTRTLIQQGMSKDGVGKEGPFYLGLLEAAEGNYNLATKHLNLAIKRDQNYILAHQQLARVYYENKEYNKAITCLKNWVDKMPKYLDARFILAQYLDAQSRYQEAYNVLYEAQQLFKDPRLGQALQIASERLKLIKSDNP